MDATIDDADVEHVSGDEIPVAQYLRMSTEHQRYSTENQEATITKFAHQHGMRIVKTYTDAGKSGLNIRGRPALQQLLDDVRNSRGEFKAILVYDVSRWGRFPDPDEAAVYEHTCKRQGIPVIYCAEQFRNDGSLSSTVLVGLKRSMAAEYARELSVKVFAGHCNLVQKKGYRQGGAPGYGLRRQLVDANDNPKFILTRGEKKSIQTDRVLLIPGPQQEIATIHLIYKLFLEECLPERVIALTLNRNEISADLGLQWTRAKVHQILTNEKYIGNNVYNRTSFKLKNKHVRNVPSDWVRKDGAYEAIVPLENFLRAQAIITNRSAHLDDSHMLELLKQVLERHGLLSGIIIDEEEGIPSSSAYRSRFGSLLRAYNLIGFSPKRDYAYLDINRSLRRSYPELISEITSNIEKHDGSVICNPNTDLLIVNGEFSLSVVIARCKQTAAGTNRWKIRLDTSLEPDITIVVRMNSENQKAFDYYILPSIDFSPESLPIREENDFVLDAYRTNDLEFFYSLASRTSLYEAA